MVLVFWFCRAICCLCLLMSNHSVQCRLNNPSTRWNFPSLSSSHKLLTWLEFQVSPNIFLIKFRTHPPQIPSVSSVARTIEILHKETIFFGSGERCNKIKLNLQFWGFLLPIKSVCICVWLFLAFLRGPKFAFSIAFTFDPPKWQPCKNTSLIKNETTCESLWFIFIFCALRCQWQSHCLVCQSTYYGRFPTN